MAQNENLKRNEYICAKCGIRAFRPAKKANCLGCKKLVDLCRGCFVTFTGCNDECRQAQKKTMEKTMGEPLRHWGRKIPR